LEWDFLKRISLIADSLINQSISGTASDRHVFRLYLEDLGNARSASMPLANYNFCRKNLGGLCGNQ